MSAVAVTGMQQKKEIACCEEDGPAKASCT
jgi:hypothetical protein